MHRELLPENLPALPKRPLAAHKGNFGHVYVLGGSMEMGGALSLAALAAYRAGAGLVTGIGHPQSQAYFAAHLPEATWMDWPPRLASSLPDDGVLALGPGLGQGLAAHDLVREAAALPQRRVWDADALNILARFGPGILQGGGERICTPHPGEAARLLHSTAATVQADREAAIAALVRRYGGVWVLKGEGTLVSDGSLLGRCPWGNPGMATGGSGDVLTGLIAGLWAQGLRALEAASLAVCIHARAGDLAADELGEASLLARDILAQIPRVLQNWRIS
ncbi:NAD(P)H-hydrate dehydratase [Acidithiobacillus sp. AMEEHan]|uniref:NAD(P)H-hydrate dehydratase n=1 Tax=Acidithiobacillus sp. AMEEHan TaxID=2994951 RepID=UPI0027E3CA0A|nr:NAD(P)H-hydrate dehydratase [Acidithiobacillus sp. AMEEHan]